MTIYHIGVTGTRKGMTPGQARAVEWIFADIMFPQEMMFHFGDCIGVDAQTYNLARTYGLITISHPPTDPKLRAWCNADVVHHPRPYLTRDQDIVNAVSLLVVVPACPEADAPRSGTWATYRMAAKAGVETKVIMP